QLRMSIPLLSEPHCVISSAEPMLHPCRKTSFKSTTMRRLQMVCWCISRPKPNSYPHHTRTSLVSAWISHSQGSPAAPAAMLGEKFSFSSPHATPRWQPREPGRHAHQCEPDRWSDRPPSHGGGNP